MEALEIFKLAAGAISALGSAYALGRIFYVAAKAPTNVSRATTPAWGGNVCVPTYMDDGPYGGMSFGTSASNEMVPQAMGYEGVRVSAVVPPIKFSLSKDEDGHVEAQNMYGFPLRKKEVPNG